jgi:hypothetical protein
LGAGSRDEPGLHRSLSFHAEISAHPSHFEDWKRKKVQCFHDTALFCAETVAVYGD